MRKLIDRAKQFATEAHKGQMYGDMEFIYHPMQVASILAELTDDENLICAGYLHDIIENTSYTYIDLREEFNKDVAYLVREVTKTDDNTFPNLKTQQGVLLKFVDRACNIANMQTWSDEKKQKYMFEKSKFWKP